MTYDYRHAPKTRRDLLLAVAGISPALLNFAHSSALPYTVAEAYEVYSTLIPQDWVWRESKATSLVIAAETSAPPICLQPESKYSQTVGAASADYNQLIQRKWKLHRKFKIDKPYELVSKHKIDCFLGKNKGGWDTYYKAYPNSGGIIYLSPVGFTPAKDVAVVEVSHGCGLGCGGGSFSVLEKKDGKWVPFNWMGTSCAWAS